MAETRGDHAVKGKLNVSGDAKINGGLDSPYLEVIDQKARGTAGGSFEEDGWKTRDLTNTVFNSLGATITLASNPGDGGSIELEKGTYIVDASCPAFNVNEHVARLADVTDDPGDAADTVVLGTSEFAPDTALWRDSIPGAMSVASSAQTRSHIKGKFSLSGTRTLEIQHLCSTTQTVDGFGSDGDFYVNNTPNVFTVVQMWKVES